MKTQISSASRWMLVPIACLAVASTAFTQDKPKPQDKPAAAAKPERAATPPAAAQAAFVLPLAGVTQENAAKVQDAVSRITRSSYSCACGFSQADAGTCPTCKTALTKDAQGQPVARMVRVDPARGTLSFALEPRQRVQLAEIESALKANGITVDRSAVPVPSFARLAVSGATSPEAAAQVERALKEAELFESVSVSFDEELKQLHVIPTAGAQPAKLGAVNAAIAKAGSGLAVSDIAFAAPCAECSKKGQALAACRGCWSSAPRS